MLQQRVDELGISASVEFTGLVSEERRIELMQRARVYLQPTRYEGVIRLFEDDRLRQDLGGQAATRDREQFGRRRRLEGLREVIDDQWPLPRAKGVESKL